MEQDKQFLVNQIVEQDETAWQLKEDLAKRHN